MRKVILTSYTCTKQNMMRFKYRYRRMLEKQLLSVHILLSRLLRELICEYVNFATEINEFPAISLGPRSTGNS